MKTLKKTLLVIATIFAIVFTNGVYYVFKGQFKSQEKLSAGKELNIYECCSIYSMHMALWMFGWPLAPEAASECFVLHFKFSGDRFSGPTSRKSLKVLSPKTVKILKSLEYAPMNTSIRCAWDGNEAYALSSKEHRAAIALNPCAIEKTTKYAEEPFCYVISSPMLYPKYSNTRFNLGAFTITINEGLFRYLQDHKWLGKYNMHYIYFKEIIDNAYEILLNP